MAAQQHDDNDDYDDDDDLTDDGDDGDDGEGSRIRSLDALAEAVERLERRVSQAFGAGRPRNTRVSQPGSSGRRLTLADNADERRREIREELAALKAQEKADAERGDLMTRLGKVEKSLERPPRQLRKVEERMGWHKG